MNEQDKKLLLKDLSTRLSYGVILKDSDEQILFLDGVERCSEIDTSKGYILAHEYKVTWSYVRKVALDDIKPYLRPMSSMTEEEFGFLQEHLPYDFTRIYSGKFDLINDVHLGNSISIDDIAFLLDCLNKWHFDYRGLIEKGLALEAPEGMYNF